MKAYVVMHHEAGESFAVGVFSTLAKAAEVAGEAEECRVVVEFKLDEVLTLDAAVEKDVAAQFA